MAARQRRSLIEFERWLDAAIETEAEAMEAIDAEADDLRRRREVQQVRLDTLSTVKAKLELPVDDVPPEVASTASDGSEDGEVAHEDEPLLPGVETPASV